MEGSWPQMGIGGISWRPGQLWQPLSAGHTSAHTDLLPSNSATPSSLYSCCLLPQHTKSKHVVLTMGEAAWSLGTLRARGSGLAAISLSVMRQCACVSGLSPGEGKMGGKSAPTLPSRLKWQQEGHHRAGPREGPERTLGRS